MAWMMDPLGVRAAPVHCEKDDPAEVHSRQMFALIPTTIILALSLITFGLRLGARKMTGQGFHLDDLLMGIGVVLFLGKSGKTPLGFVPRQAHGISNR